MPLQEPFGDAEAKLMTVCIMCAQIKTSKAQPARQGILQDVPTLKDAQQPPIGFLALVSWDLIELVLQGALAGHAKPGCSQVLSAFLRGPVRNHPGIDHALQLLGEGEGVIEIKHSSPPRRARRQVYCPWPRTECRLNLAAQPGSAWSPCP